MTKAPSSKSAPSSHSTPMSNRPQQPPPSPVQPVNPAVDELTKKYSNQDDDENMAMDEIDLEIRAPLGEAAPDPSTYTSLTAQDSEIDEKTFDAFFLEANGVHASMHAPKIARDNAVTVPQPTPTTGSSDHAHPTDRTPTPGPRNLPKSHLTMSRLTTIIRAQMATALENRAFTHSGPASTLPSQILVTPAPPEGFPTIHLSHGGHITDFIAPSALNEWGSFRNKKNLGKFLIRIFEYKGKSPTTLAETAKQTISGITPFLYQENLAVKVSELTLLSNHNKKWIPEGYLVSNIPLELAEYFLTQKVSTPPITFEACPLHDKDPPTFLFTLFGYHTSNCVTIQEVVSNAWTEPLVQHDVEGIVASGFDFSDSTYETKIIDFVLSLSIEFIDNKERGGISAPAFNVFAQSPTTDPTTWTKLRKYLAAISYASTLDGIGTAGFLPQCGLCHSLTHPRGLCPFPNIPNWYGGGRQKKREDVPRFRTTPSSTPIRKTRLAI
ncbi:hypothetical protein BJ138DRAFT_1119868 [Hygrophoropsis aurantiaca]|uniref:Uncharacterized protein n=1 Tax=Hygrophoropsis aurantiaca TaxID=72124 RepID=A0ACB7ZSZ4_9AGAM|nr:hypothetical protein BJ138DRAFT_1119868 [Hygrophoropsis aurantiaca]